MRLLVYRAPAPLLHDATSGFHDIKALPEFAPFPFHLIIISMVIVCLAAALYWLYKRQTTNHQIPESPKSAFVVAIEEIEQIERARQEGRISLRDIGTRTSLAVRKYLASSLDFPADDQTTREVVTLLRSELPRAFSSNSSTDIDELHERTSQALFQLERITYSGDSASKLTPNSQPVAELIKQARAVVSQLHNWEALALAQAEVPREEVGCEV